MQEYKLYINGQWIEGSSGEFIEIENPAHRKVFAKVPRGNSQDVDKAVNAAKKAFESWQYTSLHERITLMKRVVQGLKDNRELIIQTITDELGSPLKVSSAIHTDPFILEAENYIHIAENYEYETRLRGSIIRREPVGIVAGLTPWNFPLEQIEKKVIPALLSGNCVILKPSQYTPLTAYILTDLIDRAGYPEGVFNLVTGRGGEVGNALAAHPDIQMLSFTGSTDAGREVGRLALTNIKKLALELGGKSASILLPGADYEYGIKCTLDTVYLNSGQTCNAFTRLLAPRRDMEYIEQIIINQTKNYKIGNPNDPDSDIGPLASKKQFDRVKKYIELGIEEGADILLGQVPSDCEDGYYVSPVVFTNVNNNMRIAQEEIFGPVLVVIPYDTVEDAVKIANESIFGLAGAVYGGQKEANEVARQIKTGSIYVNHGEWDVNAPFGGYKQSGLGREGGVAGYEEFLEIKSIYISE